MNESSSSSGFWILRLSCMKQSLINSSFHNITHSCGCIKQNTPYVTKHANLLEKFPLVGLLYGEDECRSKFLSFHRQVSDMCLKLSFLGRSVSWTWCWRSYPSTVTGKVFHDLLSLSPHGYAEFTMFWIPSGNCFWNCFEKFYPNIWKQIKKFDSWNFESKPISSRSTAFLQFSHCWIYRKIGD